jgi:hypothetical protein
MKLGNLCPAPCFASASEFELPRPGCNRTGLRFQDSAIDGREYYAVLLRNHDLAASSQLNPKLAVVGLSPAGNQIDQFTDVYRRTGDYAKASIAGAFAGLAVDIIAMIKGLGLAEKLRLHFADTPSLARHPDLYVTSLVACATLDSRGKSDDFDPLFHEGTRRCMTERFLAEILNPAFSRLSHILILGSKGWSACRAQVISGRTLLDELRSRGKIVLNLPHPSGQNKEYVNLASLTSERMPTLEEYVSERWDEYRKKPPRRGRNKQSEVEYKAKRAAAWNAIFALRQQVASLNAPP